MNETAEKKSRQRAASSQKVEVAISSRTSDSDNQSEENHSLTETQRSVSKTQRTHLNQRVAFNWDERAKCAFFYDYVVQGLGTGRDGYLEFLPDLYCEGPNPPYFEAALSAVSLASFANRTSMSHLVLRARTSYGRALSLINEALSDGNEAKSDYLLTSLFLLAKYENISGDKLTLYEPHSAGQMELLRLRGFNQLDSYRGRSLYRMIHARQRLQDLNHCCEPKDALHAAVEDFEPGPHAARLARILSEVTKIHSAVFRISDKGLKDSRLDSLALDLYQRMAIWSESCPAFLRYWSVPPLDPISGHEPDAFAPYPKGMYVFKNVQLATGWNVFWCGKTYLLQSMLELRRRLALQDYDQSPLPSEHEILEGLRATVDDICATVPFMLEEIDEQGTLNAHSRTRAIGGYFLVRTLHVAGSVTYLSSAREAWILDRLTQIGYVFGIKQALALRDYRMSERAARYREGMTSI